MESRSVLTSIDQGQTGAEVQLHPDNSPFLRIRIAPPPKASCLTQNSAAMDFKTAGKGGRV